MELFLCSHTFYNYFSVNSVYFPQTFLFCNSYNHCHLLSSCINSLLLSLTFQYNGCLHIIYYTFCCQLSTANTVCDIMQSYLWIKNISEDNAAYSFRVDVLSKYSYQLPGPCGVTTQNTKFGYSQR